MCLANCRQCVYCSIKYSGPESHILRVKAQVEVLSPQGLSNGPQVVGIIPHAG